MNIWMPKVSADKEEVIFEGEIPNQPSQVYELIMAALSDQGRAVVKFLVDGVDALQSGEFPETFEEIEAFSLSHDELTLRLILESIKQLGQVEEQFDAYVRISFLCLGLRFLVGWISLLPRFNPLRIYWIT